MDLEGIKSSEISQTEEDKYCIIALICGISKHKTNKKTKQEQTYRYREQTGGCQRWGSGAK